MARRTELPRSPPLPSLSGLVSPSVDVQVSEGQPAGQGAGFHRLLEGSASERLWTGVTEAAAIHTHSGIRGDSLRPRQPLTP